MRRASGRPDPHQSPNPHGIEHEPVAAISNDGQFDIIHAWPADIQAGVRNQASKRIGRHRRWQRLQQGPSGTRRDQTPVQALFQMRCAVRRQGGQNPFGCAISTPPALPPSPLFFLRVCPTRSRSVPTRPPRPATPARETATGVARVFRRQSGLGRVSRKYGCVRRQVSLPSASLRERTDVGEARCNAPVTSGNRYACPIRV